MIMARDRRTTTQRGLGHDHQAIRRALLPSAYGQPCPLCGKIMKQSQDLDLDHQVPRMTGRPALPRITHRSCNRRAGSILGNQKRWHPDEAGRPSREW